MVIHKGKYYSFLVWLLCLSYSAVSQSVSLKEASGEVKLIGEKLVPDKRVAIFDFELTELSPFYFLLKGESNLPEAKEAILAYFAARNLSCIDSFRLLPDQQVGEHRQGLIALSVANLRSRPDHASELVSQALMGTPVRILDKKESWYRVQTPDYYLGWIDAPALCPFGEDQFNDWKKAKRYLFVPLTGWIYEAPTLSAPVVGDLVSGCLFEGGPVSKQYLKIRLPDGRIGFVPRKQCIEFDQWINRKPSVEGAIQTALAMNGSPYLWGGASAKTVDCSGLVKITYFTQALILARDASQQAMQGKPVDFHDLDDLLPGDLLFFGPSFKKIVHVGIYLGKGQYIHASGRVQVNSIVPGNPGFNLTREKNLVVARRILSGSGVEEWYHAKNQGWYSCFR